MFSEVESRGLVSSVFSCKTPRMLRLISESILDAERSSAARSSQVQCLIVRQWWNEGQIVSPATTGSDPSIDSGVSRPEESGVSVIVESVSSSPAFNFWRWLLKTSTVGQSSKVLWGMSTCNFSRSLDMIVNDINELTPSSETSLSFGSSLVGIPISSAIISNTLFDESAREEAVKFLGVDWAVLPI